MSSLASSRLMPPPPLQIDLSMAGAQDSPLTTSTLSARRPPRRSWSDCSSDSEDDAVLARAGVLPPSSLSQASSANSFAALDQQQQQVTRFNVASAAALPFPGPGSSASAAGSTMGGVSASPSSYSLGGSILSKQTARSSRAPDSLVIDQVQIEKLKLQFRDTITGKFDRALELDEFVDAFSSVLGRTRKEFKCLFMKIDSNSDGSIDWQEFSNFMLESGSMDRGGATDGHAGSIHFVRSNKLAQVDTWPGKEDASKRDLSIASTAAVTISTRSPLQPSRKSTFHTGMISKLLFLPAYDRYVTGGRDGLLKFWQAKDLAHVRTVKHSSCWITDMCFMKKSNRIAVCSMDRVITFYDPTTFEVVSRIRDVGSSRPLSSAPTCMDSSPIHNGEEEILLIGDDSGNLLLYRMKAANWHICDGRGGVSSCRHHEETTAKNYSDSVTVARMVGLHDDWITSVKYDSRLGMVITASLDRTIKQCDMNRMSEIGGGGTAAGGSLDGHMGAGGAPYAMEDIVRRTFVGHKKGVYSFDYSKKFKFMASCGLERKILLWDPFTTKLISTLTGHTASVQQVLISDEKSLLISLDFLKFIRIWNLKQDNNNLKNIQTIHEINMRPGASIPQTVRMHTTASVSSSHRPENRISCMHFDAYHNRLLSCNNRISVFHARTLRDHGPKSHKAPLVGAVYIPNFNQVVSADAGGQVCIWDVDTGLNVFKFEAGSKTTSISLDGGKRRLLTGSADGQVKMWNFSNGQALMDFSNSRLTLPASLSTSKKGESVSANNEIASLAYITVEKHMSGVSKYVLATGLDRKVTVYLEGNGGEEKHDALFTMPSSDPRPGTRPTGPKVATPASRRPSGTATPTTTTPPSATSETPTPKEAHNHSHKDDILCMVVCGRNHTIATGSYDGSICLWHFDSARFYSKLVPPPSSTNQVLRRAVTVASDDDEIKATAETNPANLAAINALNAQRKGVSFSTSLAAPPASKEAKERDGYTLYSPAANPWEELTPLIERAVEKLVWLDRQEMLVSAGADGILRFWDVNRAIMLCDRLSRVGHTHSENILSMKAVETIASNWEQRLALQQHMENQAMFGPNAALQHLSITPAGAILTPSGSSAAFATAAQQQQQSQDAAVAAINEIDAKPPVHYTFLLTGDSLGHLIVWDVSQLEFRFEKDLTSPSHASPQPTSILTSGRRHISSIALAATPTSSQAREIAVMVHPKEESIFPVTHWQAHENSACLSIDYLNSYKMVCTGGGDGRVLLWTRHGDLVGMFGQSSRLDGCWDLHDPETFRSTQGGAAYINRSLSESESESDGEEVDDAEVAAATRSRHRSSSESSESVLSATTRVDRSRLTLASLYPESALDRLYDESPPHTPIEDEGRTRSNTPDAEEQARAAAIAQKNKASTVDSLAALGRQAIRDKENATRRAAGLPTVEEAAEIARRSEEEKAIVFSPAVGARALGGVGSINSLNVSRRTSVVTTGVLQPANGTTKLPGTVGQTLKSLLQSRRQSAGAPSTTADEPKQMLGGGASPSMRNSNRSLPKLNFGGISQQPNAGVAHTAPSSKRRAAISSTAPSIAPSPFVPLLSSREGFEFFKATIFNKQLSAAHPSNNAPAPRSARDHPLVHAMLVKEARAATQIESDEEKDDFFSNEGGHASSFFQTARSNSLHAPTKSLRQEEEERRRNKLIFGALSRGARLAHEDEDADDDADDGLLRADSTQASSASLRKGAADAKKKKPLQSQRMQGVSAVNIRRRLGSVHASSLSSSSSGSSFPMSTRSSARAHARSGIHDGGARTARPSPGFLRDWPIDDVPYDTRGKGDDQEQEEFVR